MSLLIWLVLALFLSWLVLWQFRQFAKTFGPAAMLNAILGTLWGVFGVIAWIGVMVSL